jgi:hypothetical protein
VLFHVVHSAIPKVSLLILLEGFIEGGSAEEGLYLTVSTSPLATDHMKA